MRTKLNFCCGDGHPNMVEVETAWEFKKLGLISGFLCWKCPTCGQEFIDTTQDALLQQRITERKLEMEKAMVYRYEWAISDIHGEYDKLLLILKILEEEGWDPEQDLLVFLGDMVDRGSNSRKVIAKIKELNTKYPDNIKAVLGNHDRWFVDLMPVVGQRQTLTDFRNINIWFYPGNGGEDTYYSYKGCPEDELTEHLAWAGRLPLFIETEKHFYSHAPVPAGVTHYDLAKTNEYTLIWSYHNGIPEDIFAYDFNKHEKVGVCGHIHALREGIWEPRVFPHYIYLDAGCGCHPYARLYAANLTTRMLYGSSGEKLTMDSLQKG